MSFNKSSLYALAVLFFSSALTGASPLADNLGTSMTFARRGPLTTESGVFDHERAKRQMAYDHNKYRRHLANIEANLGSAITNDANVPQPRMYRYPWDSKRQAAPAYDLNDIIYGANLTIGTPGQPFFIEIDSGSPDLWVASVNCTDITCASMHKYDPSQSSTAAKHNGSFFTQYADHSTTEGEVWSDTVTMAGVTVRDQYFSPAYNISDGFANETVDGVLGLALRGASVLKQDPFMFNAKKQGAIKDAIFGMKLTETQSELYVGGTDKKLYQGQIEFHPVHNDSFWIIEDGTAWVGNKSAVQNISTTIDSGTSIIYGPADQVAQLYAQIPGARLYDTANQTYSVPCNQVPTIAFSWGGRHWNVSQDYFNRGKVNGSETDCVGAVEGYGETINLGWNVWILGDSFMKNVYTAFDIDNRQVGFASLK